MDVVAAVGERCERWEGDVNKKGRKSCAADPSLAECLESSSSSSSSTGSTAAGSVPG